jgi:flagellar hook-basal body complex protein FliE
MVTEGLSSLNGVLLTSQVDMQQLAVGEVQNLHQIMIRLEESRLSFELMLQVRNRVLEAYQEFMKMQV